LEKNPKNYGEKEQRILEAAGVLFARYGLKKTSVDEIAQMAGLGKGTIYLYFKSKEELFAAIVQRFGESLMEGLQVALAQHESAAKKLEEIVRNRMQFVADRIAEIGMNCEVMKEFEETETSPSMAPIVRAFRLQQLDLIEGVIREGQASGEFMAGDAHQLALAILCALEAYSRSWPLDEWLKVELGAKVAIVSQLFLNGLLLPARRNP